jgi:mono/diheme cytochrome c family protein
MQERSDKAFGGAPLGQWYAPNITSDPISGIGGWSQAEITAYLKTGRVAGKAQAAGGMAEAVTHSLSHLPQSDLDAIAAYVKTIPAVADPGAKRAAFSFNAPLQIEPSLRGARSVWRSDGASLYSGLCASCHGSIGGGTRDRVYPSLFNNSTVGATRPDNLIAVILNGVDRTTGGDHVLMPGFGEGSFVQPLSDQQVAAVATFVRQKFGPGDSVTEADVATARKGGPGSLLLPIVRVAMTVGALIALTLAIWMIRRRNRRSGAGAS